MDLRLVTEFALEQPPANDALDSKDQIDWDFDGRGGFWQLRWSAAGAFTCTRLEADGAVAREETIVLPSSRSAVTVDADSQRERWQFDALGDGRWIVWEYAEEGAIAARTATASGRVEVHVFDARAATLSPASLELPARRGLAFETAEIAPDPDGDLLALGRFAAAQRSTLLRLAPVPGDASRWSLRAMAAGSPDDLEADAACPYGANSIAVLDRAAHRIRLYDSRVRPSRELRWDEALDADELEASMLRATPDGGLLLTLAARGPDGAGPRLLHFDPTGALATIYHAPREALGEAATDIARDMAHARLSPKGFLWLPHLGGFAVLDASGELAARVPPWDPHRLSETGPAAVLADGRSCIQDRRSGALHVWEADGSPAFVGAPIPGDAGPPGILDGRVRQAPDGSIRVMGLWDVRGIATRGLRAASGRWSRDGAPRELTLGRREHEFEPDGVHRWEREGGGVLARFDRAGPTGECIATMASFDDWRLDDFVVGAGGEVHVLCSKPSTAGERVTELATYSADGELRSASSLTEFGSDSKLAHGGDWLAVSDGRTCDLLHLPTGRRIRARLPERSFRDRQIGFASDGTRLVVLGPWDRRVRHYELPTIDR